MLGDSIWSLDWKGNLVLLMASLVWLGIGFFKEEGSVYFFPVILGVWALFCLSVQAHEAWTKRPRRRKTSGGTPLFVAEFGDEDDDEEE